MRLAWCALCETKTAREPYYFKPANSQFAQRIKLFPSIEEPWLLTKCRQCGVVSTDPLPSPGTLASFYNASYYHSDTREEYIGDWMMHKTLDERPDRWPWSSFTARRAHRKNVYRLRNLKKLLPQRKGIRFLDVGCGTGDMLVAASELGWNGLGVEISRDAASCAQDRSGIHVICGACNEVELPGESFDIIYLQEVLEHVPTAGTFLRTLQHWLKPGGLLYISVPNDLAGYRSKLFHRVWWIFPPVHLHYFTLESLTAVVSRTGLRPISHGSSGDAVPVDIRRYLGWSWGITRRIGTLKSNRACNAVLKCLQAGWDHALFLPVKMALSRGTLGFTLWLVAQKRATHGIL